MTIFTFSARSKQIREQLHPQLQQLVDELIKHVDFAITEGHRDEAAQLAAFHAGKSKAMPGKSKHNTTPSQAVHLVPFPIPEPGTDAAGSAREWREYAYFAGAVNLCAASLGIRLRWGGDWNDDFRTADNKFNDLQHYELF